MIEIRETSDKDSKLLGTCDPPEVQPGDISRLPLFFTSSGDLAWAHWPDGTAVQLADTRDPFSAINYVEGQMIASRTITELMGNTARKLVMSGVDPYTTNIYGTEFMARYVSWIQAYILACGNRRAAQILVEAILADPPQWWDDSYTSLFESTL